MDKVVHFEIPVDDMKRAKKFYEIFNWQMQDIEGMDYVGVRTVHVDDNRMPKEAGAINGGMMQRTAQVTAPVVAIHVSSVDEYLKKVLKAGGKMVMPKMEIPGMGYYAYISDTEGNVVGLWETMAASSCKK
ncbi:MAG: VOC family protein [Chlamydiia bacterium]|nr:VOC family protein [Chlamydiia bacterium]